MSRVPVLQARIRGVQGIPGKSNILAVEEFSFTATDGQKDILFPVGKEYIPGNNSLFIYVDGVALSKAMYQEVDRTTVRLITPLASGKEIFVKYINFEETETVKEVVVSTKKPTRPPNDVRDGLIWFNPETKNFAVYSVDEDFFIELAFRRDFSSPNINIPVDGGTF